MTAPWMVRDRLELDPQERSVGRERLELFVLGVIAGFAVAFVGGAVLSVWLTAGGAA